MDATLIVLATLAVTMEKMTRAEFQADVRDINCTIPPDQLTRCNISSLAAATGMNRETVRRKVAELVSAGVLIKDARAGYRVSPAYTRAVPTSEMLSAQLQTLINSANDLIRHGIVELG